MEECLTCKIPIKKEVTGYRNGIRLYRKFCSKRCAAIMNNTLHPKREVEGVCVSCKSPCPSSLKYCSECKANKQGRIDWDTVTIHMVKGRAKYQKNAHIRNRARLVIAQSGLPKECVVCGYSKHVEVSHIRPINTFPTETLVSVVNHIDNLEYLCPNHHCEHENEAIEIHKDAY